jgi:hypothetical protein
MGGRMGTTFSNVTRGGEKGFPRRRDGNVVHTKEPRQQWNKQLMNSGIRA